MGCHWSWPQYCLWQTLRHDSPDGMAVWKTKPEHWRSFYHDIEDRRQSWPRHCSKSVHCSQAVHEIQLNKLLKWSPYSIWDHWVQQSMSYQRPGGRHWVTKCFLLLPPECGTVCRQQSLLRQPRIHSVEPWKLIYSPHLSHHLSYIICILS